MAKEEKKITFEEYKAKYTHPERQKLIKTILVVAEFLIAVIIVFCLTLLCLKVYEINDIAGYITIGVSVILFIVFYIIPIIWINKKSYFITNVKDENAARAKRHNRMVRHQIADKMIEVSTTVDDISWYNQERVNNLIAARNSNDEGLLKNTLTGIYNIDVKKASDKTIANHAVKIGILTGLSQSEYLDAMVIALFELDLIKELIYLHGFRPSDAKLMKIYGAVIRNTLLAYGLSVATDKIISAGIGTVGGVAANIPFIGGAIATILGSASQALINGIMTISIGYQTRLYLMKEYKLQDILDGFEFNDDQEELTKEVMKEIGKGSKKK